MPKGQSAPAGRVGQFQVPRGRPPGPHPPPPGECWEVPDLLREASPPSSVGWTHSAPQELREWLEARHKGNCCPRKALQGGKEPYLQIKPVLGSTAHTAKPLYSISICLIPWKVRWQQTESVSPGRLSECRQVLAYARDLGDESKTVAGSIKCFTAVGTEDGRDFTEGGHFMSK